ncbi:hypothetical protein KY285_010467 [Solanum tuberosum]|nr:hypothetical protein KY289_011024 [Solanum tuberosum]KAH0734760.1 hypothetical protein KY285_010467 [Solanum tuberosum]
MKTRFNYIIYTPFKEEKECPSRQTRCVNIPDVHVPSLDPKEPTDRSGIKQVKKYLKKYIDKKFQHLEDLTKLNHQQLMNVVWNPHKQEEEVVYYF